MKWILLLIPFLLAEHVVFQNCAQQSVFETTSIDLTPITPKPGDAVVITINGVSLEHCEAGTLQSTVMLKNVPVFEYHYDLCQISEQKCPVEKGDWTGVIHQLTPRFAFPGLYTSKSVAKDNTGRMLSCVEFNFNITR